MSNAKKIENSDCNDTDLPKVCHWSCPFCQFQCYAEDSGKRSQVIRFHLDKLHSIETRKAKEKNIREGSSTSGRHGLGIEKLLRPIQFQKITKEKARIICPYCKLGADTNPGNAALRKKTWKHHLKSCTKAPKDCTLKMLYAARMKQEGGICLGDGKSHRRKMINGIWKKADDKAHDLGHSPFRLLDENQQTCDVICVKCWRVASHSRTWSTTCEGGKLQDRSRILPSARLWKKFIKKFGQKLFEDLELNMQQREKIQTAIQKSDQRKWSLKKRQRRQGSKKVSKKEHKRLRLAGLRNKALKSAKDCGHDPVRLDFQRLWQSGGCSNLICRKCWRISQHSKQWRSKCIGHHRAARSILPSRAWWKNCIEKIGSELLFKIMQLNSSEKKLIKEHILEYTKRRKEYTSKTC